MPDPSVHAQARSTAEAARALSLVGHPALLMPAAVALAAVGRGAPPVVLWAAVAATSAIAASVVLYSLIQVRRGRWSHMDASIPRERRQLNRFLALLLLGAAALLWWAGQPEPLYAGLALAGGLVVAAQLLRRWLKVSLHAAFAVFAAALLWPGVAATAAVLALAAGVAWSRLALGRHTRAEVAVGLLAGAGAGLALHLLR